MDIRRFIFKKSLKVRLWKLINTFYWLIHKNNIIVINSWITQRWNKVLPNNLGDDLNYYLIKKMTGKKVINYRDTLLPYIRYKNYLCIGSIIENQTMHNTIIWGSGAMYNGNKPMKYKPIKVLAVRGPKTQEYLIKEGIECPNIFGDPALLISRYFPISIEKQYKLGIIPHYEDFNCYAINEVRKRHKDNILIIDLKRYVHWTDVIYQINQCECIASSSLHGLIISDSYKIPNVWVKFSNNIIGGDFKYLDYFMAVKRDINKPLDFTQECICLDRIINCASNYKFIDYDFNSLISSCPFLLK